MTTDEIKNALRDAVAAVAPEAKLDAIDPKRSMREQLDLDSMDFLNVLVALHKALAIDVPERDYGKLDSVDGCIAYLAARAHGPPPSH
jgi:acyl carrier protein